MVKETHQQFMLWLTLNRISDRIEKHEEKLFRKTQLTKSQHKVLLTIAFLSEINRVPIKLTDLVPFQNISLASMSLIIDRMEKKHLVKKVREPTSQRSVSLTVTTKGENLLKKSSNPTTELIKNIFSVFSDAELEQATILMNKLLKQVEKETEFDPKIYPSDILTLNERVNYMNKLTGDL